MYMYFVGKLLCQVTLVSRLCCGCFQAVYRCIYCFWDCCIIFGQVLQMDGNLSFCCYAAEFLIKNVGFGLLCWVWNSTSQSHSRVSGAWDLGARQVVSELEVWVTLGLCGKWVQSSGLR